MFTTERLDDDGRRLNGRISPQPVRSPGDHRPRGPAISPARNAPYPRTPVDIRTAILRVLCLPQLSQVSALIVQRITVVVIHTRPAGDDVVQPDRFVGATITVPYRPFDAASAKRPAPLAQPCEVIVVHEGIGTHPSVARSKWDPFQFVYPFRSVAARAVVIPCASPSGRQAPGVCCERTGGFPYWSFLVRL